MIALAPDILAAASSEATTQPSLTAAQWLTVPSHWPAQGDLLSYCQTMSAGAAALLVLAGVIYLLCGFYIFKILVTLNAALVGGYVGMLVGERLSSEIICALVGGFTAGIIAWPLMKWAVAVMGGIYGALLGTSIWMLCGLKPEFAWAGGGIGLVAFGLLSFVLFRASVMMYTSLQGSVMLVFGVLGLIYKYRSVAPKINESMALKPFLLPICIFVPMLIGLIYQQSQYPADAKGGGGKK